jgi:Na+/proline symporter
MEELLGGLILATATLSLVTALTVQAFAKPLINEYIANANWHGWATNVAALAFAMILSYAGQFVLELLGSPQLIVNAALQGLVAALGATFGYEVWKNVGKNVPLE